MKQVPKEVNQMRIRPSRTENERSGLICKNTWINLIAIAFLTVNIGLTQAAGSRLPTTDAEKIADALRAGPAFITNDATLLDWPSASGGEYRVLRQGSNKWTCLPAIPGYPHDEPGCFDAVFLRWIQDSLAGRTPRIHQIGISYMYLGAWVKSAKGASPSQEFHVGPHLMVLSPHQDDFQGFNRDGSNGMPYVTTMPNRSELFLVIPIRQWDER
jgi:hypothetical protein